MFHPTLSPEAAESVVRAAVPFALGRKFTADDVAANRPLVEAAVTFLENWKGDFEYLLAMHSRLHEFCDLSDGQWAGVINCWASDLRRQQPQGLRQGSSLAAQTPLTPTLPNGFYTITFPGEDHLTIKIDDHWEESKAGTQVAYFLNGPQNTASSSYKGFAFVYGNKFNVWPRFRDSLRLARALTYLLDDGWKAAGPAYAFESGNCCFCNRTLTTPESCAVGYGPSCAEKHGLPWGVK